MKQWIWFLIALVVVAFVLNMIRTERFEARFVDTSQQKRAMKLEDSSYAQRTNHFVQSNDVGEAPGTLSPWQVNQYQSKL
jgi:biopolymer transport protein ExbB/TolQ